MKRSTERILTTHTGSLARSPELLQMLLAREEGKPVDPRVFDTTVRRAVTEKVKRQVEAGIAVVNDGEQSKIGFATYVRERLNGFGGPDEPRPVSLDAREFRTVVAQNVGALNSATRDIPEERVRMHVCWGAGEGPRNHDVPLRDIVDVLLQARPAAMSIMGANGRHEHEWKVWKDVKLPNGKVLIPGVIDSTTNIIEHPEVVAERIVRYANVLGRENVMAGVDCGFGTNATTEQVDPKIAWAKLRALVEGAELASRELWGK